MTDTEALILAITAACSGLGLLRREPGPKTPPPPDEEHGHGPAEVNTYGLPDGAPIAHEIRHWAAKQMAEVLGTMKDIGAPIPDAFPDLTGPQWLDPMATAMTPILGTYYDESGKQAAARLGLDPDAWQVKNPHVREAIARQSFTFCRETNHKTSLDLDEALRQLRAGFAEGLYDRGETLVELRKRVETIFDRLETWRAEAIAATEASRAVHAGQLLADEASGVVAGVELLLSSDACPLCRMVATEARRVRLGQAFAIIGSHPEYSNVRYPPLHPHCQCTMIEVLKPEYGGPTDVDWYNTLVQPIPKDWEPPKGKPAPTPDPARAKAPLRPRTPATPAPAPVVHPEVPDRVAKPGGRPEGPGAPNPLPPDLSIEHLRTLDLHKLEPTWGLPGHGKISYGGVLVDDEGRVLLREPKNHFDGYHWTFAKGKVDAGEHPVDAALREVLEETGNHAAVLGLVPGGFKGGTSTNYYFLMRSTGHDPSKMDAETESTRWVTIAEARALIGQTTNATGRARDLAVLDSAVRQLARIRSDSTINAPLRARPAPAPDPVATPAAVKPRAPRKPRAPKGVGAAGFPKDPNALEKVRDLGGSTGAELVRDPATGTQYVRKRGASPDHLREECHADAAYRQLGARVPAFQLYEEASGPVKLSEYLDGAKTLGQVLAGDPALAAKAVADLKRHFAADCLLGNWDVVGLGMDNVLVDPAGNAWRIDNGGALRYRAMGTKKTASQWDAYPTEVWTLRDRAKNAQTSRVFGDLSIREIAGQVKAMEGVDLKLPAPILKTVAARMDQLKDVARRANTFLDDSFHDGHADGLAKHMIGLRKAGARDKMPEKMEQVAGTVKVEDQDGKAFDHLRGKGSLVSTLQKYIDANGGDYRLASDWMRAQGGSSWSDASKALKYFLARNRDLPDTSYFWAGGIAKSEKAYRAAIAKAGSEEKYRATFQALHAFTHDYLEKADFPLKDSGRGTVKLMRTEDRAVMRKYNLKPGEKGLRIDRGVAESTSIYKRVAIHGTEKTVQDVPIHRVIATYWQERDPGKGNDTFLGDHENEFVCLLDGIPFDYEK